MLTFRTKIVLGLFAVLGLGAFLLPSEVEAQDPNNVCDIPEKPAGVLYMTFDAKVTSNTSVKNGDVNCASPNNCYVIGDKHIRGLLLKGEKPVVFSGWAGGGGQSGELDVTTTVCKDGQKAPMPPKKVILCAVDTEGNSTWHDWGEGLAGDTTEDYGGENKTWTKSFQGIIEATQDNYKDGCERLQEHQAGKSVIPPAEIDPYK
jgi:hypothetical protein